MFAVYCIGSHQQQHKILEKYQVIPCSRKFTVTVLMLFERQSRITNVMVFCIYRKVIELTMSPKADDPPHSKISR